MTTFEESKDTTRDRAEPFFASSDDDLVAFALPTRSSASDVKALVRRHPLLALLAAIWIGIGLGKLTRLV